MATSSTRCWDCGGRLWYDDDKIHPDYAIADHRTIDCSRIISNNYYSPEVSAIKNDGERTPKKRKNPKNK